MRRNIVALLGKLCLMGFLVWAGGCASAGSMPNYNLQKGLELGKVKRSEYRKSIGEPLQLMVETNSDGTFECAIYAYAEAKMTYANMRALALEFRNDLLNGYSYLSNYDDDRTVVDAAVARQIKPDVSTRDDVLKLLGQPHGRATTPTYLAEFAGHSRPSVVELWRWTTQNKFSFLSGAGQILTPNIVIVGFDANGVVKEVAIREMMDPRSR